MIKTQMQSQTLTRLDNWKNKHKSHSVDISIDDGYGATCWQVKLHTDKFVVYAQETSFLELPQPEGEVKGIPYIQDGVMNSYYIYVDYYTTGEYMDTDLEMTIDLAITFAEGLV
jgi:hypothetical protein